MTLLYAVVMSLSLAIYPRFALLSKHTETHTSNSVQLNRSLGFLGKVGCISIKQP